MNPEGLPLDLIKKQGQNAWVLGIRNVCQYPWLQPERFIIVPINNNSKTKACQKN